jgi:hypothetical protein
MSALAYTRRKLKHAQRKFDASTREPWRTMWRKNLADYMQACINVQSIGRAWTKRGSEALH